MGYYAKVIEGNVTEIIVADQYFIDGYPYKENCIFVETFTEVKGGVHYDRDGNPDGGPALRMNTATVGGFYVVEHDVFHDPRPTDINNLPCDSWTLDPTTWVWLPPVAKPSDDARYRWDETKQEWLYVPFPWEVEPTT